LKKLLIFAVGIYTMLMFAGLVFAQASAGKLAARTCSTCHGTDVICEKLGARNAFAWANTVERMRSNGAKLSEADAATIVEYLATAKPGSKHLCK
jgi:cytochrome c553